MRNLTLAYDYAARMHAAQRRKGAAAEPYINHLTDVVRRLAQSDAADETLLIAGVLHDIVEDTDGTEADVIAGFGPAVASIVMEVTDDKTKEKAERKRLQVATIARKSEGAKRIKLADKASNLAALCDSPPAHWDHARRAEYVAWACRVIVGCRGVDPLLEAAFDAEVARARTALGIA